jgi:hypothetical protein
MAAPQTLYPSFRPTNRALLGMFLAAVALRAALAVLSMWAGDLTLLQFASIRDGSQYLAIMQAWLGHDTALHALGPDAAAYTQRLLVFPLYPAVAALFHGGFGLPLEWAALLPNWLLAGLIAPLGARILNDSRVGWALAVLTPSVLLSSVLISSEAVAVAFALLALALARDDRPMPAGIALALAGLGRPVALFAALGIFVMMLARGRARRGALLGLTALVAYALGMAIVQWRFGPVLASVQAYTESEAAYGGGGLLAAPFWSLIDTPRSFNVAPWKVGYIYLHVVIVLVGCVWMLWHLDTARGRERHLALALALWLWGNTLFVLCIGDRWGFDEFHRFITPALPPLLWALRDLLPSGRRLWGAWLWVPIALASLAMAYFGLADGFAGVRALMPH